MEPPHKNNGQAEKPYMAILSGINRHFHMALFIASSTSNSFLVHNIHHSFLFHLPCFPLPSPTRTIMTSTVNFLFLFAKKKHVSRFCRRLLSFRHKQPHLKLCFDLFLTNDDDSFTPYLPLLDIFQTLNHTFNTLVRR